MQQKAFVRSFEFLTRGVVISTYTAAHCTKEELKMILCEFVGQEVGQRALLHKIFEQKLQRVDVENESDESSFAW